MSTDYRSLIRDIPDFPQAGIMFRDITPLLGDAEAYKAAIQALAEPFRDAGIDQVAAIEARGYMLGCPLAVELGAGFVPVRKVGKLPFETYKAEYALEYGEAEIEMHRDGLLAHHRVLLIDDVLATGGTMAATIDLVQQSGATVAGVAVLIELAALDGRKALGGQDVFSLITL
ncbi:MAG: adenine phosphoribosyltransferase [Chloroflexi bacterium]|nr:adenine phosphoribosyltransferase [Chloroflexota bacterium]MDA1173587.1 adenine phosphoribosyltransferase [Chloroflexota bacterium]